MRMYKTFDGKAENQFGYDEKILSVEKTIEIIYENHEEYKKLLSGVSKNPDDELVL